ncbi:MAG: hypothetical protein R3D34_18375 [Nitratireductor sp.]
MAINITDKEELQAWLQDKPQEWSALIAQRVALRVSPLVQSSWRSRAAIKRKQGLTQSLLRANLFSAVVGRWPTTENKNAAYAAAAYAVAAYAAAYSYAGSVAAAADSAARADYAVPAAAYAAAAAVRAARAPGATGSIWKSTSQDLQMLEDKGLEALQATPIWHDGEPDWFSKSWTALKHSLLADNPNWQVWIDFLQRRFLGKRSLFGLASDSEKEIIDAIVEEGNEFWERDPHVVNADLVARIEEKRKRDAQNAIDNIPPKSPGLSYAPGPSGKYEREATGIATSDDLAEIEGTKEPLLEALDDLKSACTGTNAYTTVVRNAERYAAVLNAELSRLSVDRLFSYGVRLENARSRLDKEIASGDFPEMAVGIGEALDSVLALHGPMVLSTGRGRDLVARARDYQLGVAQANALKEAATPVATAIANSDNMVETEAADEIVLATSDIGEGPHPERSTEVGATALRNFLVSAAKVVGIAAAGVVGNAAWGTITGATGATSLETLAVYTYEFFLTYRPDLLILAGTGGPDFAWLSSFLNWLERQQKPKPGSD